HEGGAGTRGELLHTPKERWRRVAVTSLGLDGLDDDSRDATTVLVENTPELDDGLLFTVPVLIGKTRKRKAVGRERRRRPGERRPIGIVDGLAVRGRERSQAASVKRAVERNDDRVGPRISQDGAELRVRKL